MKKFFNPQIIALGIIFIVILITAYFYQKGEISFLSRGKEKKVESEIVEVPLADKEYKLFYQDRLNSTFNIADFEDNENWQGDGDFDYTTFFEGNSSLFLSSYDHRKAVVSLNKSFDIKDVLNFKLLINLGTDSADIEIYTTKLSYEPGDSILVLGEAEANSLFTISLIDPNGNTVQEKESFSNYPEG